MSEAMISDEDAAHLAIIAAKITRPENGLPNQVFDFALHIVPMVNVDLVVLNDEGAAIWVWRDDKYGQGWHIPGGIIRVGEPITDRIAATATGELCAKVVAEDAPRAILQFFSVRGTFISLVYGCRLVSANPVRPMIGCDIPEAGDLCWIKGMPERVYPVHACYKKVLPVFLNDQVRPPMMMTVNE